MSVLTINAFPSTATITATYNEETITGIGQVVIEANDSTVVSYTVEAQQCTSKSGTFTISGDMTEAVALNYIGSVSVDTWVPSTGRDTFPTHIAMLGKGGWRSVESNDERDAIPSARREAGMSVYVTSDEKLYILNEDLTTWTEFQPGSQKGGWKEVETAEERDAIPDDLLEVGMMVYVTSEAKGYILTSLNTEVTPTLKTWSEYIPGQGEFVRKITTFSVADLTPIFDGEIIQYQGPTVPPYWPGYFFRDVQRYAVIREKSSNLGPSSGVFVIDENKLKNRIRINQSLIDGGWSDVKIVFSSDEAGTLYATNGETEVRWDSLIGQNAFSIYGLKVDQSGNYPIDGSMAYVATKHMWEQIDVQPHQDISGKLDKVTDQTSVVYGIDENGDQTTYGINSFGQIDNVAVHGVDQTVTEKRVDLSVVEQVESIPDASEDLVGRVVQYTGGDTQDLVHNYFYECKPIYTDETTVVQSASEQLTASADLDTFAQSGLEYNTQYLYEKHDAYWDCIDPEGITITGLNAGLVLTGVVNNNDQVILEVDREFVWEQVNVQPQTDLVWGNITGTLSDQTDLQNALDAKQDTLTAGTNITIEEDSQTGDLVISSVAQESFFRGRFENWSNVPTDPTYYEQDLHNPPSKIPEANDYIVVNDMSDWRPADFDDSFELWNDSKTYTTVWGYKYDNVITKDSVVYSNYPTNNIERPEWKMNFGPHDEITVSRPKTGQSVLVIANTTLRYNGTIYTQGQTLFSEPLEGDGCDTTHPHVIEFSNSTERKEGTWRMRYQGVWDTDGKSGWKPEYQIENVLPIANSTEPGITKLYTTTGNNTDGTMDQNSITTELEDLQDQIDDLKGLGRFLSVWNSSTGLPETNPETSPYEYKSGDYYLVGTVSSSTNYRPDGTSYTKDVPSTIVETEEVHVNDVYIFDGSVWKLQANSQREYTFSGIAGSPYDNTNLSNALNAKQDLLTNASNAGEGIIIDDVTQEISTNNIVWRKW